MAWCRACGRELQAGPGPARFPCPSCGAQVDLSPWLELDAVARILSAIEAEQGLPAGLGEELGSLLAGRARLLREGLPPRPEPVQECPAPESPSAADPILAKAPTRVSPHRLRKARKKAEGPGLWERLGPAFGENLGFALAGFLIVAGGVFFATTAWTTMSGAERLLVVSGGLALLGGVLLAAGRLLNRGGTLPEVERVLLIVSGLLAAVAAVPAGDLLAQGALPGAAAGCMALALALLAGSALARAVDSACMPFLPAALGIAVAGVMAAPFAAGGLAWSVGGAALLLLAGTSHYSRKVVPTSRCGPALLLMPPALLGFALVAFTLRAVYAQVQAGLPPVRALAALGVALAALGAGLVGVEGALRRKEGVGGPLLPLLAIALGVAGSAIALGEGVALAFAAALGAWAGLRAGLVLPVPWLVLPGLGLAGVAYFQAPAPVREAALRLRDHAAVLLGYAGRPLPLGYYGLTFLPYVAACALAGIVLARRGRPGPGLVFRVWALGCGLGLAALALLASGSPAGSDLRPPAAVLAAQGALLLWTGGAARGRWTLFLGGACVAGGLACGLGYLEAGRCLHLLALAGLGLLGLGAGAWCARRPRPGAAQLRAASLECAAALAAVLVVLALAEGLERGPACGCAGFLALSLLLAWVAHAFRSPIAVLLSGGALAAAAGRLGGLLLPASHGGGELLGAALVSTIPFFWFGALDRVRRPFRHPLSRRSADPMLAGPGPGALAEAAAWAVLVAQVAGLGIAASVGLRWSWPLAAGLAIGALGLLLAARPARREPLVVCAALQLLAASLAACGALGGQPAGSAGLLSAAIALTLAWAPAWLPGSMDAPRPGTGLLGRVLPLGTGLLAAWSLILTAEHFLSGRLQMAGLVLAAASLLGAVVVRFAVARVSAARVGDWFPATLFFGPAAIGLLLALEAQPSWYPLGLLAAGGATLLWAGKLRLLAAGAGLHALAGLAVATALALQGGADRDLLLAAFLGLALAGRLAAARARFAGGLFLLAALLGGLSFILFPGHLGVADGYQPALWIGFAGAALLAARIPVLGVSRAASRVFSWPILGLAWAGALALAVLATFAWQDRGPSPEELARLRAAAAAFALASCTSFLGGRAAWRRIGPVVALALAAFLWAPVNLLLSGPGLHRPDVELALLGLLLVGLLPTGTNAQVRIPGTEELGRAWPWPVGLSLAGVLLAWGEWGHASTPLAFAALAAMALTLFLRDRRPGTGGLLGLAGLAALLALAAFLRPAGGPLGERFLLLPGAAAALAALGFGAAGGWLLRPGASAWQRGGGSELNQVGILAALLAMALVGLDAGLGPRPASAAEIGLALLAVGFPSGAAIEQALRGRSPVRIHAGVAGVVLLGAFLSERTDLLDLFAGFRLHVLALLGGSLILASHLLRPRVGRLLAIDGLLLALPALLFHAPAALGLEGPLAGSWSALALASLVAAAGAQRLRLGLLWWAALGLANLVLFAVWRDLGLFDPSFYGVPPGLTLIGGSLTLGRRAGPQARLALLGTGLALLYGPVALQVLMAGLPVHALVLFGLGLATVLLGFRFRRNAMLALGMAVVVLDVVVYLASRGFETDFLGAGLLIGAGLIVLAAATGIARKRRQSGGRVITGS